MRMPEENQMVIANEYYFDLDCKKTRRNNNVLIVGSSGAGKTRGIVTPNLLQASGSYIVTDPKGNLYHQFGGFLRSKGYTVKLVDFKHPEKSIGYNPFHYIQNEQDITKLAYLLIYSEMNSHSSEDLFWRESAVLLLSSIIGYLHYYRPEKERNLDSVIKLLLACEIDEYNPNNQTVLDRIIGETEQIDPQCFVIRQYKKFRIAAGKTLKSVLISLFARLRNFESQGIKDMMKKDQVDIHSIGVTKTALFITVSDTDRSLDGFVNLFFTQAMEELCRFADDLCDNSELPIPVRFIMDDFATNCKIDNFPKMIASIRSRNISTMLIIQDEAQLTNEFGADGQTIISNCDTYAYLGGNDIDTAESIAKRCNLPMKKIMTMPVGKCWVFRRGETESFTDCVDYDLFLEEKGMIMVKDRMWDRITYQKQAQDKLINY